MNSQKHAKDTTLVFGVRAIIETLLAGKTIDKVFIQRTINSALHKELVKLIKKHEIPYSSVPQEKLNKITRKNHQGAIAFLSPIAFSSLSHVIQANYEKGKVPLIVILDRITDVRNFGAIVRTAVCANADALVIPTKGSTSLGGDAMKTSAGALSHIPICREANLKKAIQYLKASGLQIMACHEKATDLLYETDLTIPLAIMLGSEDQGISPAYLKMVDKRIKIPIWGPIDSLNVSVAAATVLYESVRQRKF
ncbi:MAG: 23S rRNA (guanosine(2251)-2'-O)-methyltransferase RlmB [Cytophagales bacterium]|nr:23S rRNA (guanosine(2251)-2'-O)-methyltransferase RlmB [Cytophagales bacterium]